ncbi:MAG: hypothetical protein O3B83_03800 [Bacteroidetes bacterium]|nr:hypothetical protein [Bacteroidota bacterium]
MLIDYDMGYGLRGKGYVQIGTLAYENEDSTIFIRTRLDPKVGKRSIGSQVYLTHSVSNPRKFRIDGYFEDVGYCEQESFYRIVRGKSIELTTCNGVLERNESELNGKNATSEYWTYNQKGDTLEVSELFDQRERIVRRLVRKVLTEDSVHLVDLKTDEEYRK